MRKSLLIAALGAVLPMFMADGDAAAAAAASLPPGDVPATSATEAGTATVGESTNVASGSSPSESSAAAAAVTGDGTKTADQSSTSSSATAPSDSSSSSAVSTDSTTPDDVPNVAPAAAEPTTEQASATSAAGADTTSPTVASSPADALPLRAQVAQHLEAIYRAVANADKPVIDEAYGLKQHIGDVLQSIHNGIDVRSGEMVQKLEALFHKL